MMGLLKDEPTKRFKLLQLEKMGYPSAFWRNDLLRTASKTGEVADDLTGTRLELLSIVLPTCGRYSPGQPRPFILVAR
jgi:hypothetical protein